MLIAKIRANDCVGCAKCLAACPTDAIIGAQSLLHTVLSSDCIGCGLCLPPCPVDCIEMLSPDANFQILDKASIQTKVRAKKARLPIINTSPTPELGLIQLTLQSLQAEHAKTQSKPVFSKAPSSDSESKI